MPITPPVLPPPPLLPPAPTVHSGVGPRATPPPELKSSSRLAKAVQILTGAVGVLSLWTAMMETKLALNFSAASDRGFISQSTSNLELVAALTLGLAFICMTLNAFLTMIMMERMSRNGAVMGPNYATHKSHWAATGWMVPFLNLVRPRQMVLQIWDTSRERSEIGLPPLPPRIINYWWASFVSYLVIQRLAPSAPLFKPTMSELATESTGTAIGSGILAVSAVLFILTVRVVVARHEHALADPSLPYEYRQ